MSLSYAYPLFVSICFFLLALSTLSPKYVNKYLSLMTILVIILSLAVMSYYLQCKTETFIDLTRIANEALLIKNGNFQQVLDIYALNPLSAYYIYTAVIFNNINILKFFSSILFYGPLLFIPYIDWVRANGKAQALLISVLFIFTFNYPSTLFGIRQGPAFAIGVFGVYLSLIHI